MVEGSLCKEISRESSSVKNVYLQQTTDKLQEGSQITLPDGDSKAATIHCAAHVVTDTTNDPKELIKDLRAYSKIISNGKTDSVKSDPLSQIGEMRIKM